MKRRIGLFFVLLALMPGITFAQNTVLGRPTFEKTLYDHTYLDENGAVKIRDVPKIIKWDYFADELIIEWNKPENSSLSFYVARIDSLDRATRTGGVREIVDPISLRRNSYGFSREDLALQSESNMDKFYGVRFTTATEKQLFYWAREFEKDPAIKSVSLSPVFRVVSHAYNDPLLPKQWNFSKVSTSQAHHFTFGSQSVYAFVLDTGVFLDHEDIDRSRNFFDYDATDNSVGGPDDYGHGTHVYTTICAVANNEKGIVGLAPNIHCGNIKVLFGGSGSFEMVANGFLVAASKALEIKQQDPQAQFVMNLSLGGFGKSPVIDAAVEVARKAGILIVAAAGNSATNIDSNSFIPASSPGVIAVAATDQKDKLANFSNYGSKTVLLAAPGVDIWAGVPSEKGLPMTNTTGYMLSSGTSMASPHVASYAALVLSTGSFTEDRIKFLLFANNDDVSGLTRFVASGGRVNLALGLDVPEIPPSPVNDLNVDSGTSHSSARLAWTSPGDSKNQKLVGAKLYFSTKEFNKDNVELSKDVKSINLFPLRKGYGEVTIFTLPDLVEDTSYNVAVRSFDRGGNFSPLSPTIEFKTKESKAVIFRNFETENGKADPGNWTVADGPLGELIKVFYKENPLLWHMSETGAAGGSPPFAWRYGLKDEFSYKDVVADALIISEVFDVRTIVGLTVRYDKFQQIGNDFFGIDVFELYVKVLDDSNRGDWQLVRSYSAAENSKVLRLETTRQDLSAFEGKKFQVGFRFLSVSSGQYVGPIIDNFEVRVDK